MKRTRTAVRHDPAGPTADEADRIRGEREAALAWFCWIVTGACVGLMLAHMAGVGL